MAAAWCGGRGEACCRGATSSGSTTLDCCDSAEERCDEKCILAAAAFECERTCEEDAAGHRGPGGHEHAHDADGHHPASACSTHLAKAFEQYSAYLESARCICRSIFDRGSPATCCQQRARHHHHGAVGGHGCKTPLGQPGDTPPDAGCCGGGHGEPEHGPDTPCLGPGAPRLGPGADVEKAEGRQHVVVAVDGMTCSGCGNKMVRVLGALPGVSAVRVNFVMGTAEFSLDTALASADHVLRAAERATGFRCTRRACDDQTVDVLASGAAARALVDARLPGLVQAAVVGKRVVRLTYDPTVVGARTLVDRVAPWTDGLAPPRHDASVSGGRKRLHDQLAKTVAAACLTIPVVVMAWGDGVVDERTEAYVAMVLATAVQLIAVPCFYRPALTALVHGGSLEMDMLVVISITAAYAYSVVAFGFTLAGRPLETEALFETSALLITFVLLGGLVAAFARIRAVEAVSLRSLQAATAVVVEDGKEREIDARLLQYGDRLTIGPHTAVPTDAIVVSGSSEVDESMLTGESVPVCKRAGDSVTAGTVNGAGVLVARLTRLPGNNTVTDIARLVEEAAGSKPRIQDTADRVAGWFVPVVGAVAVAVVVVWVAVGLEVRHHSAGRAVSDAITYAVATLAVSCPCALGLAVPMVLVVAGGIAARNGVVIKSAQCTERARLVTDVVLDKTGTLTEADLDVVDEHILGPSRDEAVAVTRALVAGNKHPVSLAVARRLGEAPGASPALAGVRVIPGAGVEAAGDGAVLRAGSPQWTGTAGCPAVARLEERGMTLLIVTRDGEPLAVFGLRTRLRAEAARVVGQLQRGNVAVHVVSGDQRPAVEAVAAQVGIPAARAASRCSPADKRDYVARLMAAGRVVMFVGDGTNDAVAVTQADVGVQLASVASASDVTRGAADVVLLNGLEGIPFLLRISAVAFRRMVFNFAWSAVYNVLAVLLASGALVRVRIPPAYAGLGEIVSVLPVVVAAMTMLVNKTKGGD